MVRRANKAVKKLGRPAAGKARKMAYSITLDPELVNLIDQIVGNGRHGVSRSAVMNYIIKLGLDSHNGGLTHEEY